jgi:hypothetical protein
MCRLSSSNIKKRIFKQRKKEWKQLKIEIVSLDFKDCKC